MGKNILKITLFTAVLTVLLVFSTAVLASTTNPSDLQINVGDTVVWTNNGQTAHTVTSDSEYELGSSPLNFGNSYSHTFTSAGTFAYHCEFHPQMRGVITVGSPSSAYSVQTNPATNILNYSATLNGNLLGNAGYNAYVWFQWGNSTSYGNVTQQQLLNYSGSFNQNISNLSNNTTYHFRAVVQGTNGTVYGQDMIFTTTGSEAVPTLTISKKVINLTSGNLNWQASVNAKSGDVLAFVITIQAGNQDVHNVFVRDILPAGLTYKGNMTVNASINYSGNPASGIGVGTIPAGGITIISYQAQANPTTYGSSVLTNNATITSNEAGTQTASASVFVTGSAVYGATDVPTGLTNNPVRDSFLLPVFLIILMSWMYFTGRIYVFADWLGAKI